MSIYVRVVCAVHVVQVYNVLHHPDSEYAAHTVRTVHHDKGPEK